MQKSINDLYSILLLFFRVYIHVSHLFLLIIFANPINSAFSSLY